MAGREGTALGAYHLRQRLGNGVAGEVYLADGPESLTASSTSDGRVVVKVLGADARDAAIRDALSQLRAVADLHNPHIIPLYGVAQSDAAVGVVMAFAPAGSLQDALREESGARLTLPLGLGIVARIVQQLASGLAAAHDAGILHGDLKPSNIFVRTSPQGNPLAVVADFGQVAAVTASARIVREPASNQPRRAWAAEQLRFAAPELLAGGAVPASDQYALAAIAYYLLTGHAPRSDERWAAGSQAGQPALTPPSTYNALLPAELDAVLLTALADDPAWRYASMRAFAGACDEAAAAGGVGAGITQQMARLAVAPGSDGYRVGQHGGAVLVRRDVPARRGGALSQPAALPPDDAPPQARRRLIVVASMMLMVLLLSCVGGGFLLSRRVSPLGVSAQANIGRFSGPNTVATVAANPAQEVSSSAAKAASAALAAAQAQAPLFSDTLQSNTKGWRVDGKASFFASDHLLHLYNQATSSVVSVESPGSAASSTDLVVSARMTFERGYPGDLAGISFLMHNTGDGSRDFYTFLLAADGHFEVWAYRHADGWSFVGGQYSTAIKTGTQQSNTLAVRALGQEHKAELFVNGTYVNTMALPSDGPTAGRAGLIVIDDGAEAAFADFTEYRA